MAIIIDGISQSSPEQKYASAYTNFVRLVAQVGPYLAQIAEESARNLAEYGYGGVQPQFGMSIWPALNYGPEAYRQKYNSSHDPLSHKENYPWVSLSLNMSAEDEVLDSRVKLPTWMIGLYPFIKLDIGKEYNSSYQEFGPNRIYGIREAYRYVVTSPTRRVVNTIYDAHMRGSQRVYHEFDNVYPTNRHYYNATILQPELWQSVGESELITAISQLAPSFFLSHVAAADRLWGDEDAKQSDYDITTRLDSMTISHLDLSTFRNAVYLADFYWQSQNVDPSELFNLIGSGL